MSHLPEEYSYVILLNVIANFLFIRFASGAAFNLISSLILGCGILFILSGFSMKRVTCFGFKSYYIGIIVASK